MWFDNLCIGVLKKDKHINISRPIPLACRKYNNRKGNHVYHGVIGKSHAHDCFFSPHLYDYTLRWLKYQKVQKQNFVFHLQRWRTCVCNSHFFTAVKKGDTLSLSFSVLDCLFQIHYIKRRLVGLSLRKAYEHVLLWNSRQIALISHSSGFILPSCKLRHFGSLHQNFIQDKDSPKCQNTNSNPEEMYFSDVSLL